MCKVHIHSASVPHLQIEAIEDPENISRVHTSLSTERYLYRSFGFHGLELCRKDAEKLCNADQLIMRARALGGCVSKACKAWLIIYFLALKCVLGSV